jgi:hypothetical protein
VVNGGLSGHVGSGLEGDMKLEDAGWHLGCCGAGTRWTGSTMVTSSCGGVLEHVRMRTMWFVGIEHVVMHGAGWICVVVSGDMAAPDHHNGMETVHCGHWW